MADLFGKMAEMQQQMADTQARLAEQTVTAEAGGGMVTVVANGTGRLVSVKIDPEAVDPDELEMLEDLVVAGVNKALEQAEALKAQRHAGGRLLDAPARHGPRRARPVRGRGAGSRDRRNI